MQFLLNQIEPTIITVAALEPTMLRYHHLSKTPMGKNNYFLSPRLDAFVSSDGDSVEYDSDRFHLEIEESDSSYNEVCFYPFSKKSASVRVWIPRSLLCRVGVAISILVFLDTSLNQLCQLFIILS
ncbi:unnamed protein product [Cuscuta epithymum]|uniref:Uncharacterized protein n=1 Tax=Cuscuta epithymum TaxID=186058 RepID=A0AAV0DEQ1_9ASTE|nr:unnamed protein product [Cuscuta epithymum]